MLKEDFRDFTLHKPKASGGNVTSLTRDEFETDVMKAVREARKPTRVALNMSDIKFMSTAGYRVLLMAAKEAGTHGGQIALANVKDNIWGKLKILGFESEFRRTTLIPAKK